MVTLDAADSIADQLSGLTRQRGHRIWELIVVDGGSTDSTCDLVMAAADSIPASIVRLVESIPSIALQRNHGIAQARASRVLFCDADDQVGPDWVEELSAALDRADVVAGSFIPFVDGDAIPSAEGGTAGLVILGESTRARSFLPWGVGASLGARRDVLIRLGGFDDRFDAVEDIEFCWRAQLNGATFAAAPNAVVAKRLRRNQRDAFHQHMRAGRAWAGLFSEYHPHGMPRDLRHTMRSWCWLILHAPGAAVGKSRGTWIRVAGERIGRLRGAGPHRVRRA